VRDRINTTLPHTRCAATDLRNERQRLGKVVASDDGTMLPVSEKK
jgi:hypothetical protein